MSALPHASVHQHRRCRACQSDLKEFLNLGDLRLNGFPKYTWELDQIPKVPLILTYCLGCGLVQLDRTVPPDWLYREYWYRSAINETMVTELEDVVMSALQRLTGEAIGHRPVWIDIGANDGTLLQQVQRAAPGILRVGVEPAMNLADLLWAHADVVYSDYFPNPRTLETYGGSASVVTAIAMCYDLEDPLAFFKGLEQLLAPGGIAVVQFQDFARQIEAAAFDNICHEHLEYYTLWSLQHLVQRAGLIVQAVETRAINGGSLRVWLKRRQPGLTQPPADPSVTAQLIKEMQLGLGTPEIRDGQDAPFRYFARKVEVAKTQIQAVLQQAHDAGKTVDIYGASTKGNILLQILGVGPALARQAIDRDPRKVGRMTLTGIPIVSEATAMEGEEGMASMWLTPIWQFKESVLRRERWYIDAGGTIVFPLPVVEVVQRGWVPRELKL